MHPWGSTGAALVSFTLFVGLFRNCAGLSHAPLRTLLELRLSLSRSSWALWELRWSLSLSLFLSLSLPQRLCRSCGGLSHAPSHPPAALSAFLWRSCAGLPQARSNRSGRFCCRSGARVGGVVGSVDGVVGSVDGVVGSAVGVMIGTAVGVQDRRRGLHAVDIVIGSGGLPPEWRLPSESGPPSEWGLPSECCACLCPVLFLLVACMARSGGHFHFLFLAMGFSQKLHLNGCCLCGCRSRRAP